MERVENCGVGIILVPSAAQKYFATNGSIIVINIDRALIPASTADPFRLRFPVSAI
jgi:hypothetical protein